MTNTDEKTTLFKRLKELDSQEKALQKQKNALNAESQKWAYQRDSLNFESKKVLEGVKINRDRRNEINRTVKRLKDKRSEILTEIDRKRKDYITLKANEKELLSRTFQNADSVKNKIIKLDWELQTNSLSLTEEKEIIDQIRLLERQLLIHKEATTLKDRLTELKVTFKELNRKKNEAHNQIIELSKESQEHHMNMLQKINELKRLKEEADGAHKKYIQSKKAFNETQQKYFETIAKIKLVNEKVKKLDALEQNKKIEKETETAIKEASNKLTRKKRITLDEFKLLKKKGLI